MLTATEKEKAACAGAWLTDPHILQPNTRYIILAFRKGDGSLGDFTEQELALLNQCLVIS